MSDQDRLVTAVHGGISANQLVTVSAHGDRVYITETQFIPGDPDQCNNGSCFETVICFEIGAIDAVILELRKVKMERSRHE